MWKHPVVNVLVRFTFYIFLYDHGVILIRLGLSWDVVSNYYHLLWTDLTRVWNIFPHVTADRRAVTKLTELLK